MSEIPAIPVYFASGVERPLILDDVLEAVFESADRTGGTIRLKRIRMEEGDIVFRKPLLLAAHRDVSWTVAASDLPLRGSGATVREAMDDLASSLVETVRKIRRGSSANDPIRILFSGYIDLDRPCPDPYAHSCRTGFGLRRS